MRPGRAVRSRRCEVRGGPRAGAARSARLDARDRLSTSRREAYAACALPPWRTPLDPDRTRAAEVSNHLRAARHTRAHSSRQRRIEYVREGRLDLRLDWLHFWPTIASAPSLAILRGVPNTKNWISPSRRLLAAGQTP